MPSRFSAVVLLVLLASICLVPNRVAGQVPGVCTAPDGGGWNFGSDAPISDVQAYSTPVSNAPERNAQGNDLNHLKRWMNRDPALTESVPKRINRYAAGEPTNGHNTFHHRTVSPPSMSGVSSPHSATFHKMHSVGHAKSVSIQDDDLLGSSGDNDLLGVDLGASGRQQMGAGGASDPLGGMGPDATREAERQKTNQSAQSQTPPGVDPHWEVYANDRYPSAMKCAKCHQKIYDEWRVSSHAYSAVSPMFNRFEQKVHELVRGTSGTFCLRCHAPIATQADYPRDASLLDAPIVFREGITCIVCHRVVERYGRVNGERRIEPGSEYDPVVGGLGGDGVNQVIADKDNYKVKIDPNDKRPLQPMHQGAIQFEQLSDSSFCAGCHQVVVQPGIGLEIVYQQYRQGPACKKGISCQDCHMGAVPGKPLGYEYGAAAEVNQKTIRTDRKHSNHIFWGPAVPLAHPGIFPHNEKALRWAARDWLQFDHRQGWGTEAFERALSNGLVQVSFPQVWQSAQERRDARKIIEENQKLVAVKRGSAIQVLENGSRIDGPFFATAPVAGQDLKLSYIVSNTSEGHNMPSGSLGAQPQLWLNVVLIGPNGEHLWESGHLDSNGDMCDIHSLDVRAGKVQRDAQLVNFQTKFLITNLKGTEREMYLPVNVDIDPLPFFRPGTVPYTVLNHPPFIRMEAHSIPPMDSRTARYKIPASLLNQKGRYRLSVRLRSRVEPPYFLLFCDGTPEMLTTLNESILDAHPYSTEFVVR
jgi:hypothetical protein